jgi:O-antigen ligase
MMGARHQWPALAWPVCIAAPWLNPFAPGPSPNVAPLIFSWLCAAWFFASSIQWAVRRIYGGCLAALTALSVVAMVRPSSSTLAPLLAVSAAAMSAAAVRHSWDRSTAVKAIAQGWVAAAVASSVIGLLQYFGLASALAPLAASSEIGEAYSNLRQRNQFATLTSLGLLSALWLRQSWSSYVMIAVVLVLALGNAASASRTGALQWVVIAAGTACWSLARADRDIRWMALALVAYGLSSILLPLLLEWATGHGAANVFSRMAAPAFCGSRFVLWANVLELSFEKPWTGWGWGELDYAHYVHLYPGERFCDILDNAHNLLLHLAVELGWPVAVLICTFVAWWTARQRPWRETERDRQLAWLAILSIALHSLVEYPLWYGPFQMALGLGIGLLWSDKRTAAGLMPAAGPRALLMALSLALAASAAWDYRRISQLYLSPEARAEQYKQDPFGKAAASWLFQDQVRFAELSVTALTRANAQQMHTLAQEMLHFSPEPRVIKLVIESAVALGRHDIAAQHMRRFRAAFPAEYEAWVAEQGFGRPR